MFGKVFVGLNGRPIACQRIDWRAWSGFNGSAAKVYLAGPYFAKNRANISYQKMGSSYPQLRKLYCVAKSLLFVFCKSSFLQAVSEANNFH